MNLYATVFVDADLSEDQLRSLLAMRFGGRIDRFDVVDDTLEISVRGNDDYHPPQERTSSEDAFLFFRFRLEVNPSATTTDEAVIHRVGQLLEALWSSGAQAVASCDFEHLLPRAGGFDWKGMSREQP